MTHVEQAGQCRFLVVDDRQGRQQALLFGHVVDELTGRVPFELPVPSAEVRRFVPPGLARDARLVPVARTGGRFALAGLAAAVFPPSATWVVNVSVSAPGFLATARTVVIPPGATFPIALGTVPLRRRAVFVNGLVVRRTTGVPIAGAVVTLLAPAGLVSIPLALRYGHATGMAVTPIAIVLPGPGLAVGRRAPAGAEAVWLQSRSGIAVGSVLRVQAGPPAEYAIVAAVDGPPPPASGWVRLRDPIANPLRPGTVIRRVSTPPTGAATAWFAEAFVGDQAGVVVNPAALVGADAARIEHADPAQVEYRHVTVASPSTTGADGAFTLGFVSRTATVRLRVSGASPAPVEAEHVIDFEQPVNRITLRI